MDTFVPNYYEKFSCIGSECIDNCCIGWEIDIDSAALEKYSMVGGVLGEELRSSITRSEDGSDCFALAEGDRCPFLNEKNLCRLIIAGGEDMLCEICSLHPRFREWFGDRCEMGIGLCCEEAARIIINSKISFGLHLLRSEGGETKPMDMLHSRLLKIRAELFEIINGCEDFFSMCEKLLYRSAEAERELTGNFPNISAALRSRKFMGKAVSLLSSLEPINGKWENICGSINADNTPDFADTAGYKNILAYFIFRYFMKSGSDGEIFLKSAFAVFSAQMIALIEKSCGMSLEDSACLWSKEVEYSCENLEVIFDFLYEEYYSE